ncbi:MAG: hypothetical protein RL595_3100 [Planctomycetota bacterium]|jgi:hypothetical protein
MVGLFVDWFLGMAKSAGGAFARFYVHLKGETCLEKIHRKKKVH